MLGDTTEMAGSSMGTGWIVNAAIPCVLVLLACLRWRSWRIDVVLPILSVVTLWILQHGYWDAVAAQLGPDATIAFPHVQLPVWVWLAIVAVTGGSALIAAKLLARTPSLFGALLVGILAWAALAAVGTYLVVPYAVDGLPFEGPMLVDPDQACRTVARWGGAYLPVLFVAFALVARIRRACSGAGGR